MSDRILVQGVRVVACHGVLPHEKSVPAPFVVDLDAEVALDRAGRDDALAESVSYADLVADARAVLLGPPVDLVETLAERIADAVLARPLVQQAAVTVHKPHAPVGFDVADVAVRVTRERSARVVIALGANLDHAPERLADAVRRLAVLEGLDVRAVSPLVETDPIGGPPDQPGYLNAAVVAGTRLAPETLLARLHEVEAAHGRRRDVRWGPRTLDLDLITYVDPRQGGNVRRDSADLTVPHPRAYERAFVLVPWLLADPEDEGAATAWRVLSGERAPGGAPGPVVPRVEAAARLGVRPGPVWPPALAGTVLTTTWQA